MSSTATVAVPMSKTAVVPPMAISATAIPVGTQKTPGVLADRGPEGGEVRHGGNVSAVRWAWPTTSSRGGRVDEIPSAAVTGRDSLARQRSGLVFGASPPDASDEPRPTI
jgi:hypothetical protein